MRGVHGVLDPVRVTRNTNVIFGYAVNAFFAGGPAVLSGADSHDEHFAVDRHERSPAAVTGSADSFELRSLGRGVEGEDQPVLFDGCDLVGGPASQARSEERRVGKECRS